ncbi:Conserved_hypothetical protein [Hexamita inflata]|uniref:HTH myb-type domain-containing protein n=1 Tax=Hexamita inflata TaxID=28002 RepID=A0ABP1HNV1_9EUKA
MTDDLPIQRLQSFATDEDTSIFIAQEWPVVPTPNQTRRAEQKHQDRLPSVVQFYIDQDPSQMDSKPTDGNESFAVTQMDVNTYMQHQQKQTLELIKKVQQQQQFKIQQNMKKVVRQGEFRWSPELHDEFVLICMAVGVRKVTPKQLQQILNIDASRESIGSHLQKFRMKLAKQHGLCSSQNLENHHFPVDVKSEKLAQIEKMWQNALFGGMTLQEVSLLLKK